MSNARSRRIVDNPLGVAIDELEAVDWVKAEEEVPTHIGAAITLTRSARIQHRQILESIRALLVELTTQTQRREMTHERAARHLEEITASLNRYLTRTSE